MNSTSKTILAVMGAAAVGAIIGMLVALVWGQQLIKWYDGSGRFGGGRELWRQRHNRWGRAL